MEIPGDGLKLKMTCMEEKTTKTMKMEDGSADRSRSAIPGDPVGLRKCTSERVSLKCGDNSRSWRQKGNEAKRENSERVRVDSWRMTEGLYSAVVGWQAGRPVGC